MHKNLGCLSATIDPLTAHVCWWTQIIDQLAQPCAGRSLHSAHLRNDEEYIGTASWAEAEHLSIPSLQRGKKKKGSSLTHIDLAVIPSVYNAKVSF
jgi:hypothetical protein